MPRTSTQKSAPKRRPKRTTTNRADDVFSPTKPRPRKTRPKPVDTTQVIHLAMSPHAANLLRAMLGKSRHDVKELDDIHNEIVDQLEGD